MGPTTLGHESIEVLGPPLPGPGAGELSEAADDAPALSNDARAQSCNFVAAGRPICVSCSPRRTSRCAHCAEERPACARWPRGRCASRATGRPLLDAASAAIAGSSAGWSFRPDLPPRAARCVPECRLWPSVRSAAWRSGSTPTDTACAAPWRCGPESCSESRAGPSSRSTKRSLCTAALQRAHLAALVWSRGHLEAARRRDDAAHPRGPRSPPAATFRRPPAPSARGKWPAPPSRRGARRARDVGRPVPRGGGRRPAASGAALLCHVAGAAPGPPASRGRQRAAHTHRACKELPQRRRLLPEFLGDRNTSLESCTQADIDAWLVHGPRASSW